MEEEEEAKRQGLDDTGGLWVAFSRVRVCEDPEDCHFPYRMATSRSD